MPSLPFPWLTEIRTDGFYVVSVDGVRRDVAGPFEDRATADMISAVPELLAAAQAGDAPHAAQLRASALQKAGL